MGLFTKTFRSSDLRHARSDYFLPDIGEIPKDPQEAYDKAYNLIKEAGWSFKNRKGTFSHGRKFTMTLRKIIWLSSGFHKKEIWEKAALLWHEYIHILQRKKWGHASFLRRYATARGRWYIETPAYRMSIRVYERLSGGKFNATKYVESKVPSMRKSYWLGLIKNSQYKTETARIWLQERT